MNYQTLEDGSIVQVIDKAELQQRALDLQANIDGARASIESYTATKQAEIDAYQHELETLTDALVSSDTIATAQALTPVISDAAPGE